MTRFAGPLLAALLMAAPANAETVWRGYRHTAAIIVDDSGVPSLFVYDCEGYRSFDELLAPGLDADEAAAAADAVLQPPVSATVGFSDLTAPLAP